MTGPKHNKGKARGKSRKRGIDEAIRAATWNGLVYLNLDLDAPELDRWLGEVSRIAADYPGVDGLDFHARVVEEGARRAGAIDRLSLHVDAMADLMREADLEAGNAKRDVVGIEDVERAECVIYLNTDRDNTGATISDPWDPTDTTQLDKKGRGLLYIMAQHPTYHLR